MGTKNNPAPNDCYAKADPDEPMFTLLARDPVAPLVVDYWIKLRRQRNIDPPGDPKLAEAALCAEEMRDWHREHKGVNPDDHRGSA